MTDSHLEREERLRLEAERANRAKDRFLAMLSHELRAPLAPIVHAVELLKREVAGRDRALELLSLIQRNLDVQTRLVNDLLDLQRIAQGKLQVVASTFDVHDLLREVLTTIAPEAAGRGLQLRETFGAARATLNADAGRLRQVFVNLADNAMKFTRPGDVIHITTANVCDDIVITFTDTGIGIPKERLQSIFEPFDQGDEEITKRFGGLGLGLSLSRYLVELHRGQLTADSAGDGKGAEFSVRLGPASAST